MMTVATNTFDSETLNRFENEVDRRILIVHDVDRERNEIADALANDYVCTTAASVQEALAHLAIDEYALIILNPEMVLFDEEYFHDYFRNLYPDIALIFLGHSRVNLGTEGLIHIQRPFEHSALFHTVSRALDYRLVVTQLKACRLNNEHLVIEKEHLNAQLQTMKTGLFQTMAELLKARDESAHSLSLRTSTYVELLGEAYSLNEELRESLSAAVVLRELKRISSLEFLSGCDSFRYAMDILRFEQENFDGTGTPMCLEGSEIPIASRILRVAVEFALRDEEAVVGLSSNAELDPEVVDCLARLLVSDRLDGLRFAAIPTSKQGGLTIQNS